jgi:hypothetical protein
LDIGRLGRPALDETDDPAHAVVASEAKQSPAAERTFDRDCIVACRNDTFCMAHFVISGRIERLFVGSIEPRIPTAIPRDTNQNYTIGR